MLGEIVIAKGFKGEPFVVHVCGTRRDIVYVTGESNFIRVKSGLAGVAPIGVARSNVFFYDEVLYRQLRSEWRDNPHAWDRMLNWKESANV